jgi:hypothetical protein
MTTRPTVEVVRVSRFTWEASVRVGSTTFIAYGMTARSAITKLRKHASVFRVTIGDTDEGSA